MLTPSPLTCLALLSSQIMPAYTWQKSPELNGALMIPRRIALPSSHVISLIRTWRLRIFPKKFRFFSFPFLIFFFSSPKGCPTSGCALPGPRRKRAGREGGTREKNLDRGPSRSNSLDFPLPPRAAETVEAGAPRGRPCCCHTLREVANGCRGPGCSGPGRSREGRPRQAAAARSAHVTSASTAEMERRPGDRGRMGGREAPRPRPAPLGAAAAVCPACPPRSPPARRRPHLCRR